VPAEGNFEMVLPRQEISEKAPLEQPKLYAERSFVGYGQERGGVHVILTNPSHSESVEFVYMESLPWFMKVYLHTLKVQIDGLDKDIVQEMYYRPALDRKRGTQMEIKVLIPKNSTAVLTYDFEKAILRYTEYPPDANRGFDIAPAVITIGDVSIRTTSLLLPLPTPDFSMPYNVIILTSTVIALAFGLVFNLSTRRFVAADEAEQWDLRSKRLKLMAALKSKLGKFKRSEKVLKKE
jgi:phosphatidylinositol glycan class T